MHLTTIIASGLMLAPSAYGAPRPDTMPSLEDRQSICSTRRLQDLVGDGRPTQDSYWVQISDNINCAGSCKIETSQTTSLTIEANVAGSYEWFGGGFSVSHTRTTGQSQGCEDSGRDRTCMWYEMHHTGYLVQGRVSRCNAGNNPGPWENDGDEFIVRSPNDNNRGGFHCRYDDDCDFEGANFWDYAISVGGPP